MTVRHAGPENAERAAAAIGPNIARTVELENRAAQAYQTEVGKQMKADAIEVEDFSDRAKAALGAVAAAKDDREQAKALRALSDDAGISREIVLPKVGRGTLR
jgi:hypothetical protein